LLAGLAFIADGVVVGTDGFTASATNLVAWASLIMFAVTATAAAWWRHSDDRRTRSRIGSDWIGQDV
jgi:hypothetical protein